MTEDGRALDLLHPLVREWFLGRFEGPTAVQRGVWERLAAGDNVLAEAPTGNGKTFAAFLLAISRLVEGSYPAESLSVLYVSPLKALNEDLRRNLLEPVAGIGGLAAARGLPLPAIRVETRSGDTPEAARRRFLSKPPSILCTTPESLAILLDSPRARPILAGVRLLVVDEIHAVAGTKRGAHLASSIGRLSFLAGEFARVALSATVRPVEEIARWFAGWRLEGEPGSGAVRVPRRISVVAPRVAKAIEFSVEWPPPPVASGPSDLVGDSGRESSRYGAIVPALRERIGANATTMVFCDARRRAERLAFLLNEGGAEPLAWAHHGSLAKEVREVVESRLKSGELKAVVATSSLELGIDVGSVDEVALAGCPPSVAQALQRAGRSGHGVGRTSRVRIYPFHGLELLAAGALVRLARAGRIEELRPQSNPLDVLAQVLLSLAAEEPRSADALFEMVGCLSPFEGLPRPLFDSTLGLLAGTWSEEEGGPRAIRELEPRLFIDAESGLVRASKGARRLLWSSGGTIPDRGLYSMRLRGESKRIGELDEEFVFERKVGDAFTLGSQAWRIVDIGPEAVTVAPLDRPADFIPFWKGGPNHGSGELAAGMLELLDAIGTLDEGSLAGLFREDCGFSGEAVEEALGNLRAQRAAQAGVGLPGSGRIVLELLRGKLDAHASSVLLHSFRGGRVNEGLGILLAGALEELGYPSVETNADDEGLLLLVPGAGPRILDEVEASLRRAARGEGLESLLRSRLEASGLFAAAFRENAGRALLLPKGLPGKRVPLWLTRLRAARLFQAVRARGDFPLTIETWRTVLRELIDLEGLRSLLEGVSEGRIDVASFGAAEPSPFARGARWAETYEFMYRGDDLAGGGATASAEAIALAMESASHRPRLSPAVIEEFLRKKKRLLPGWAPEEPGDLADWMGERLAATVEEVDEVAALGGLGELLRGDPGLGGRLLRLTLPGASRECVVQAARARALEARPGEHLAEWLRFEGPVGRAEIGALFGLSGEVLDALLERLVAEGTILRDVLVEGSEEPKVIDRENCEILIRMGRRAARPRVVARPPADLFRLVLALSLSGRARNLREGLEGAEEALTPLAGYPAPLEAWTGHILPARLGPGWLESVETLLREAGWIWFGAGRGRLALATAWNYELFAPSRAGASRFLGPGEGGLDFWSLRERAGLAAREAAIALWEEAWEGLLTSDSLASVLRGAANRFGRDLPESSGGGEGRGGGPVSRGLPGRMPAGLRRRWLQGAPVEGRWSSLALPEEDRDALDEEELDRERVRILGRRYGILLRPLLERELGGLSWKRLFPCMRRMELAGELLSGHFFAGVPAPQFMAKEAFEAFLALGAGEGDSPLWLSSLDPASPAGFPFEERPAFLPPRSLTNSLCLRGGEVLAVARRGGKELALLRGLEEGLASSVLEAWAASAGKITVEKIDGAPAASSPWAPLLASLGFEADRGRLRRW